MASAGVNMPGKDTAPAKSAAKSIEMVRCLVTCQNCQAACRYCISACQSCPNSLSPSHAACVAACQVCADACAACQTAADASGLDSPECMAACAACQAACAACALACIACAVECDHCAWDCQNCAGACASCARDCGDCLGGAADADAGAEDEMDAPGMGAMMSAYQKAVGESIAAKGLTLNYVKALHLPRDEEFFADVLAVKSVGHDRIRGYTFLWGNEELTDVETEFFTRKSDFWDTQLGKTARPLTWDHAQDPDTKSAPVIGQIDEFGDDAIGRWYIAQLDRNHKFRKAVDALVSKRAVGTSSDSANQYVIREKTKSGAVWLAQWPWFCSALTTTPAEPRMLDVGSPYWKSTGLAETVARMGSRRSGQSDRLAQLDRDLELLELS